MIDKPTSASVAFSTVILVGEWLVVIFILLSARKPEPPANFMIPELSMTADTDIMAAPHSVQTPP